MSKDTLLDIIVRWFFSDLTCRCELRPWAKPL